MERTFRLEALDAQIVKGLCEEEKFGLQLNHESRLPVQCKDSGGFAKEVRLENSTEETNTTRIKSA